LFALDVTLTTDVLGMFHAVQNYLPFSCW